MMTSLAAAPPERLAAARLVVTGQMIADLIIIGLGARVIVSAVTRGRQQRCYKMLIARAITSTPTVRDTAASNAISSLAHRLITETSPGLNVVEVQKASAR